MRAKAYRPFIENTEAFGANAAEIRKKRHKNQIENKISIFRAFFAPKNKKLILFYEKANDIMRLYYIVVYC